MKDIKIFDETLEGVKTEFIEDVVKNTFIEELKAELEEWERQQELRKSQEENDYINIYEEMKVDFKDDQIDYNFVYPVLRNCNEFKNNEELYKEHFTLDLDILYVIRINLEEIYVTKDMVTDPDKLKKAALTNLDESENELYKIDQDLEIYDKNFKMYSNLVSEKNASSLILSERFRRKIEDELGSEYLFVIPEGGDLLLSLNSQHYIKLLEDYIELQNLEQFCNSQNFNLISDKIYKVKAGKIEYVNVEKKY